MQLHKVMKPGKTSPQHKKPENRKGFVDLRELQRAHIERLQKNFQEEIGKPIKRFEEIVSSTEKPLKNRLNDAIAFMKQQLLEMGVSKDFEFREERVREEGTEVIWERSPKPTNAIRWLSSHLAKAIVPEIEKALEKGADLKETGLISYPDIKTSFFEAKNPQHTTWNIHSWRDETFNRVEYYLQTKLSQTN